MAKVQKIAAKVQKSVKSSAKKAPAKGSGNVKTKAPTKTAKGKRGAKEQVVKDSSKYWRADSQGLGRRPKVLGRALTPFCKWMGVKGYSVAEAKFVVDKLVDSEYAPSTLSTGVADGRSEKWRDLRGGYCQDLTKKEQDQIAKLVQQFRKGQKAAA